MREKFTSWYTSILLLLAALVCATAATTAWFTISDRTRVHNMAMGIDSGPSIRFDLDPHPTLEEYTQTLSFDAIAARIQAELGFAPGDTPLQPVTTGDYRNYTLENGSGVEPNSGYYWEFTLHFMANEDVVVHLSSASAPGKDNGTKVSSGIAKLPEALRISFADGDSTYVYSPGMGGGSSQGGGAKIFGLPNPMVYNDDNALFTLKKEENKPIVVRLWAEGTDPACTDDIQTGNFQIQLRFEATDEHNNLLSGRN